MQLCRSLLLLFAPLLIPALAGCEEAALQHHARRLHEEPMVAEQAAQELAEIGEAAGPVLLEATRSPLLHERRAATRYLTTAYRAGVPPQTVVARLAELMDDAEEPVRLAAMEAVNRHVHSSPRKCRDALAEAWRPVVPILVRTAREGKGSTRLSAINTLGHLAQHRIRTDEIIAVLKECLNGTDPRAVRTAAGALREVAGLAGPDLAAPLLDCLGRNVYDGMLAHTLVRTLLACTRKDIEAWFRELDSPKAVRRAGAAYATGLAFSQRAGHVIPHLRHAGEALRRLKARQKVETVDEVRLRILDAIGRIEWVRKSVNVMAGPR